MKCPVCSHVYPEILGRCSRCGRVAPERPQSREPQSRETTSTLIEFPAPKPARSAEPPLPDWRTELNEKVRAIKARRNMEALVSEASPARQAAAQPRHEAEPVEEAEQAEADEHANPIVAAALSRVRRATEQAARATANSQATATARAPRPAEAVSIPAPEPRVVPLPAPAAPPAEVRALRLEPELDEARVEPERKLFDPAELLEGLDDRLDLLDGLDEPDVDYTPAVAVETPPAPIFARAVAAAIDLLVVAVVSIPFVATSFLVDGDLANRPVLVMLGTIVLLLLAFYLFSTLAIAGRTIGMMLAGLRVVDKDGELPAPGKMLVRVAGYAVAALPVGIGFGWAVLHPAGSGWHDLLSGTRVVKD